MKKKIISILVGAAMTVSVASAINANTTETTSQNTADALYSLGLLKGNENGDYQLEKSLERDEGITFIVRMLGKEAEATAEDATYEMPFTDVDEWAVPYVAYAYATGNTVGTGETTFTPNKALTDYEFLTWVLRAVG